jgi:large subunit ribosomal protein L15
VAKAAGAARRPGVATRARVHASAHTSAAVRSGQTEIYKRFPKRGFSNNNFERRFHIVNLVDLEKFDNGATIDAAALHEKV